MPVDIVQTAATAAVSAIATWVVNRALIKRLDAKIAEMKKKTGGPDDRR